MLVELRHVPNAPDQGGSILLASAIVVPTGNGDLDTADYAIQIKTGAGMDPADACTIGKHVMSEGVVPRFPRRNQRLTVWHLLRAGLDAALGPRGGDAVAVQRQRAERTQAGARGAATALRAIADKLEGL